MNMSGSIVQRYGEVRGSGDGQLNQPRYLALDRYGNVLVADRSNNRVVLLSPSLTLLGYITVPENALCKPTALHLDLLTYRLYIGEYPNTGRVFVLDIDDSILMSTVNSERYCDII